MRWRTRDGRRDGRSWRAWLRRTCAVRRRHDRRRDRRRARRSACGRSGRLRWLRCCGLGRRDWRRSWSRPWLGRSRRVRRPLRRRRTLSRRRLRATCRSRRLGRGPSWDSRDQDRRVGRRVWREGQQHALAGPQQGGEPERQFAFGGRERDRAAGPRDDGGLDVAAKAREGGGERPVDRNDAAGRRQGGPGLRRRRRRSDGQRRLHATLPVRRPEPGSASPKASSVRRRRRRCNAAPPEGSASDVGSRGRPPGRGG